MLEKKTGGKEKAMGEIRIGCQTYTWEMLGERWKGSVDDILDIIARAGYAGVEITNTMIGPYYDDPDGFAGALERRGLAFPSFGFVPLYRFTEPDRIDEEIEGAEKGIEFVSHFPGCRLDLAGGSTESRDDLDNKFETMCRIYNRIGEMAAEKNVEVDVHPHSHAGSIIESAEEYERLMNLTNSEVVNWCPDTGHIVRGGLDLLTTLRTYKERIRNVHFKDADKKGKWAMMGSGICDFKGTLALLEQIGYSGWVIGEEESDAAYEDQESAVSKNRQHLKDLGY
jgi:sugar phosphate isomerase/epimerase